MPPEPNAKVQEKIKESEEDISRSKISFVWNPDQVELINQVAQLMGLTPIEYIKSVLSRQVATDLISLRSAKSAADSISRQL